MSYFIILFVLIHVGYSIDYTSCEYPTSNTQRVEWMENLVIITQKILTINNIPSWIVQGTLLGAHRDKKILEWTSDTDIQIYKHHISTICNNLSFQFKVHNITIYECTSDYLRICYANVSLVSPKLITNFSPDARLDVYGSVLRSDGLYDVTFSRCKWNFTELYPLTRYVLKNNKSFIGPNNAVPWLVTAYGKDWKYPKYYSGNVDDKC